ncbi:hypothetical protein DL771_008236 [Monosporascus sp. 5C6A]|nr:hypothetical protein DL771_008236 [Monosporascus sp. 5C6A]
MTDIMEADLSEVPDLSLEAGTEGKIITVIVGRERRRFEVQLHRLSPILRERLNESSWSIELPDDDYQAFNLFVNWQHNGQRLPRVRDLKFYFMPRPRMPRPRGWDGKPVPETPPTTKPATPHSDHRNEGIGQSDSTITATEGDKSEENSAVEGSNTIPSCIPEQIARKAEGLQSALLNLAIMAEKYRMHKVFNAAMDAFENGELRLRRAHPPHLYIARCCHHGNNCGPPGDHSLVARFMHDYAFVRGVQNKVLAQYLDLFTSTPGFARAILDRLDGKVRVPGRDKPQRQDGAPAPEERDPLEPLVGAYRYPSAEET